jgi:alcohol dehydrogenase class IV
VADILKGQIRYPHAEGVVFGPGCVREQLTAIVEQQGIQRAFLVSTPSLTRTTLLPAIREVLGSRCVGEFTESRAHTPRTTVLAAVRLARAAKADGLISFGGGSVVDLSKGMALVLSEGEDFDRLRLHFTPTTGLQAPKLLAPKLPHIAIPTTLSGGEFTGGIGITDEQRGEKDVYVDPKTTPRWVFLDASLSTATPSDLWGSTGMKLFADGIEMLCSPRATPYSNALAYQSLELLYRNLPTAVADANDFAARGNCMFAAFVIVPYLLNVGVGLVAGLRHQIGAGHGVPHGVASTIVLPHVMRWNLPATAPMLATSAVRLGFVPPGTIPERAAERVIQAVEELTRKLNLPTRLRDVGVPRKELANIAEHVMHDFVVATNPRRVEKPDDIREVLNTAW